MTDADVRTFRLPRRVVHGLLDGEAMVNNDPQSRDMQVVGILKSAEYKKAGKGYTAILRTDKAIMNHIADYLFSLIDQEPGYLPDRFGFYESDVRSAIKQIEKQLGA